MQSDTEKAVAAISEIASVIEKIDLVQTKIATAVEEQIQMNWSNQLEYYRGNNWLD